MQVLSALPSADIEREQTRAPRLLRKLLGNSSVFGLHDVCAPNRPALESYVARCFARAYQAEVTEFAPLLLELQCANRTCGVAGIRPATNEKLFLEHYLEQPVEQVTSRLAGQPVGRHEIVEICNLAALRPGAFQLISIMLTAITHAAGFRYAGFAGTAQLEKLLRRQNFALEAVAVADPARLGAAAARWGSYYETCPSVLLVDLPQTMHTLRSQYLPPAIFGLNAESIQNLSNTLKPFRCMAGGSAASVL